MVGLETLEKEEELSAHSEERSCEFMARERSASQEESSHQELKLLAA